MAGSYMTETDKLINTLTDKHERKIGHMSPIVKGTARVHYQAGLRDALDWVRDFNLNAKAEEAGKSDQSVASA